MNPAIDPLATLLEALHVSPNNLPLRRHLAESLLNTGRAAEAESHFVEAIRLDNHDATLKFGLARSFVQQGKDSQAIVVLETITKGEQALPAARVLLAKLLFAQSKFDEAARQYEHAVASDPSLTDPEFQKQLDSSATPTMSAEEVAGLERPKIQFKDVGGLEKLKEEIRLKIIHPLKHPELFAAYGKKIGGGILMYGPPGCGKTYLARATAGEINSGFMSIGINDVLDMWIGSSERNLHELFEHARRNKPCVLFFDEVDALAASRADMRTSAGRHLINQFLSEMDGTSGNNEGVLILAATNAPWHVDSAFRRPGRFDRILFVPPPDSDARAAILRTHLAGKPQQDVDLQTVAAKCEGFSGADLKAVVDLAVEAKLNEAMKAGSLQPVLTNDLLAALKSVAPSTREWFATARNYALYSNQSGAYDEIVKYLKL